MSAEKVRTSGSEQNINSGSGPAVRTSVAYNEGRIKQLYDVIELPRQASAT